VTSILEPEAGYLERVSCISSVPPKKFWDSALKQTMTPSLYIEFVFNFDSN
jgi:hypothetical protein